MIYFNDDFQWKYVIAAIITILGVAVLYLLISYLIKKYKNKNRMNKIESKIKHYKYTPINDIPDIVISNTPNQYYQAIPINPTQQQIQYQYYNLNNSNDQNRLSGYYNY